MTYPIVLAHGIARFDFWTAKVGWNAYFKFIPEALRAAGLGPVEESSVAFAAPVTERAKELAEKVEGILAKHSAEKVHIIAHSMGGLDARHAIVEEGLAEKVASLTTIGCPHWGTSVADEGLALGDRIIEKLQPLFDLGGFRDLSRESCKSFNQEAERAEASNDVVYRTYSAWQRRKRIFTPLKVLWQIIRDQEPGENDGLVSVASQAWISELRSGEHRKAVEQLEFPVRADHLNEVGWWDPAELAGLCFWDRWWTADPLRFEREVREAYVGIARVVRGRG